MHPRIPAPVLLGAPVLLVALASCGGSDTTGPDPSVPVATTILISPANVTITEVGASTTVTATVRDQDGEPMPGASVSWATLDASVASVAGGVVTANADGTTAIRVTSGSASGLLGVSVTLVLDTVDFGVAAVSLGGPTDTATVTPVTRDPAGEPILRVTPTVTSSDTSIVTVDPATGLLTARAVGQATVTAEASRGGTVSGSIDVTVNVPPVLAASESCSVNPHYAVVSFDDATIADSVRSHLGVADPAHVTCARAATVDTLRLRSLGITSLAGAQNLVGMRELWIDDNAITDIGPLAAMGDLNVLVMDDNQISDLEPLRTLEAIRLLAAGRNAITDLGPVAGISGLESISFDGNTVVDITPLMDLPLLTFVAGQGNQITSLGPVGGFAPLRLLAVDENQISDVAALAGMPELRHLILSGNSVTSLSPLASTSALTYLHVLENDLTSLDGLETHTQLGTIDAKLNALVDVSAMQNLTALTRLDVGFNAGLTDVSALLANTGWGAGDIISLLDTAVGCADVTALRATGATVYSACP